MARVNVDETVYASIPMVQMTTGWDYPKILGHLVLLWRFSQDKLRETGTVEDICKWAWVKEDKESFIEGLLDAGFLEHDGGIPEGMPGGMPSGILRVVGNQKHIKTLTRLRHQSKAAAEKRWAKDKKIPGMEGETPTSMPGGMPSGIPSGMPKACGEDAQFNTIQFNTIQSKPKQIQRKKTNVGIRLDYPPEFEQVWEKYGRKGDKKAAFEEYKLLQLSPSELSNLELAIQNYVKEKPDREWRWHLSRFLKSDWRENLISMPNGHVDANYFDFLPKSNGESHESNKF